MDKYALTAQKLRIAKLDYEIAQEEADEKKKVYEQLRRQLCNEMVASEVLKFEIAPQDNTSGLSFRLETKTRWSPVVENKDRLVEKLRNDAFDLFSISAAALTSYMQNIVEMNDGELPKEYINLVKPYDETHVVVRSKKK
jgi:hypothetical protein|nr:MAG TPA: hypothetical protein [Caudoviricetes sp.]